MKPIYDKRFNDEGRQLCVADDNTCINLAGYKETRNGKKVYHNKCDKHRRYRHYTLKNKYSHRKSYIGLGNCVECNAKGVARHRRKREAGYIKSNVAILCKACHIKAHSLK